MKETKIAGCFLLALTAFCVLIMASIWNEEPSLALLYALGGIISAFFAGGMFGMSTPNKD